ncbi:hypothetical protein [uncultured Eubacterium sp.]|uniref:hypothetical protein n=1 Tax=uncultured Eubacterium sp. TaxID=165185 RepID=UPI0025F13859|nr:hypothetical protein [uncultured Eubacterium sp.]
MSGMDERQKRIYVSSDVKFYTISDLKEMLGWSENTVQKLFNDPKFPSSDFGRIKVVEAHALIDYFSKKHIKQNDGYWK